MRVEEVVGYRGGRMARGVPEVMRLWESYVRSVFLGKFTSRIGR